MVVVPIILEWIFVLMNTTAMISCRSVSVRELAINTGWQEAMIHGLLMPETKKKKKLHMRNLLHNKSTVALSSFSSPASGCPRLLGGGEGVVLH